MSERLATQELAPPEGMWGVFDLNATRIGKDGALAGRIHEISPGRRFTLHFDKPTYMPEAMARVFLKDEAFRVIDADGNNVLPLSVQAQQRYVPERLEPKFVIASIEELTPEALVTRCAQFRGAERFTADTERSILTRFLYQAQRAADAANTVPENAEDGRERRVASPHVPDRVFAAAVEDEEMNPDDLSKAFN